MIRGLLLMVLVALLLLSVSAGKHNNNNNKHDHDHDHDHEREQEQKAERQLEKEIEQRVEEDREHASSSSSPSSSTESASSPPGPGANTLIQVQIVSRHGTRAPNPVVVDLCPSDRKNLAKYADLRLTLAGLTGTGQKELYALGVFTRQTYIERAYPHFVSNFFNDEEVYFRAVGEDRTIQSAVCMGQGMYPQGSAAIGYFQDLPSPVPVYTLPDNLDSLLEVRKKGCAAQLSADGAAWDATAGMQLYRDNEDLVRRILQICNITDLNQQIVGSGDNYGDAIKDITDAWTFDLIEGFPPEEGLNYTSLLECRTLAVTQLLGRIVGTEQQITYMNGELPERLVGNFQRSVANQGPNPASKKRLKLYAYHGHREMMYALGAFLGIEYDIKFPGLPKGAIPPATTLFFELHYVGPRGPNGEIPNAYEANGQPDPYLNRDVRYADLPPKNVKFGAPLYEPWQPPAEKLRAHAAADRSRVEKTSEQQVIIEKTELYGRGELDGENAKNGPNNATDGSHLYGRGELNGENAENGPSGEPVSGPSSSESEGAPDEQTPSILPRYLPPQPKSDVHVVHQPDDIVRIPASRIPPPPFNGYVVRAFLWHPCGDEHISEAEPKNPPTDRADCPAVPVKMTAICDEYECSMDDFNNKMQERIRRTGTWDSLCHVDPAAVMNINADVEAAKLAFDTKPLASIAALESNAVIATEGSTSGTAIMAYIFLILMAPMAYVLYTKHQARKMEEEMIEVDEFDEESESLAFNHAHPAARRVY